MIDEVIKVIKELILRNTSRNITENDIIDSTLLIEDLSFIQ